MTLSAGTHEAVVIEHCLTQSQKGTPGVAVLFEVKDAPEGEHNRIFGTIWLTEKAAGLARKSLKAIGFDPDKQNIQDLNENPTLLAGKETAIILEEDENDSRYMRIKYIGTQGITPLATSAAKEIGAAADVLIRGAKGKEAPKKRRFEEDPSF